MGDEFALASLWWCKDEICKQHFIVPLLILCLLDITYEIYNQQHFELFILDFTVVYGTELIEMLSVKGDVPLSLTSCIDYILI